MKITILKIIYSVTKFNSIKETIPDTEEVRGFPSKLKN